MNRYRYIDEGGKHLHTLDGKPLIGTSTVAKESVNKGDGLMQWYADLAALAGLAIPMNADDVLELRIAYDAVQGIQDWRAKKKAVMELDNRYPIYAAARKAAIRQRDASAEKGTDRHDTLEQYIATCIQHDGVPQNILESSGIKMFADWALANVDKFIFTEANCYSERLWIGGISDCGMVMEDGRRVVGDHKSSKNAFFDQYIQAALYDIELSENGGLTADGDHLFDWAPADGYVIFPFRSEPFTPEFIWDTAAYRKVAEGVVETYKLKQTLDI